MQKIVNGKVTFQPMLVPPFGPGFGPGNRWGMGMMFGWGY
jgi:hypothetical protein